MKYRFLFLFIISSILLSAQQSKLTEKSDVEPFSLVDSMPEYPGGEDALMKFLVKNIKYPVFAQENEIEGMVYASFVVCEDGSICQLKIKNSKDPSLDTAVYNVVSKMPNWKPGSQGGKNVRVFFDLPVSFSLEGGDGSVDKKIELSVDAIIDMKELDWEFVKQFRCRVNSDLPVQIYSKEEFNSLINNAKPLEKNSTIFIYNIKMIKGKKVIWSKENYKIVIL